MNESDGMHKVDAIVSESFENVAAMNKYIQKMILAEKMPVDTICLRRSSRATRYDGFKANIITDTKKPLSRVKSRRAPVMASSSKATDPCSPVTLKPALVQSEDIPPPTSIQQLQRVGTELCGIPAEDLSDQILLAHGQGGDPMLN